MEAATTHAPMFQEHVAIGKIGDDSVYADPKQFGVLVAKLQGLDSMEGVLAAHVGVTKSMEGTPTYVHHFRIVDKAARERVHLAALALSAEYVLEVCGKAQGQLSTIEDPRAQDHHSSLHKLSSFRLQTDFYETAHVDWEAQPSGSPAPKLPAVRVAFVKGKEGSSAELLEEYMKELRSLPARLPLLKQVSIGKNMASSYASSQLYPETTKMHWEVGVVFGYASLEDMAKVDSDPAFKAVRRKWDSLTDSEMFDLVVDSPAE